MEGRPRSAMMQAESIVRASTEFLERGSMVGAGKFRHTALGANTVALPIPLVVLPQPGDTPPLASPVPATPGALTSTAADFRAMVAALDESRDFTHVSTFPSPEFTPLPTRDPSTPSSPASIPNSFKVGSQISSAANSRVQSPSLGIDHDTGSLKLLSSGVMDSIARTASPDAAASRRGSLSFLPGGSSLPGARNETSPASTPCARPAPLNLMTPSPPASSDTATTASASATDCSPRGNASPPRSPGWLEAAYSPKSAPAGASTLGLGQPSEPVATSVAAAAPTRHGSSSSLGGGIASPSSTGRGGGGRAMTQLQYVYSPPTAVPSLSVGFKTSPSADWWDGGAGAGSPKASGADERPASDSMPIRDGLKAYYVLSPTSPSAKAAAVAASPGWGGAPSTPRGSPAGGNLRGTSAATASPNSARQSSAQSPPRSAAGHSERSVVGTYGSGQMPMAGPGPGSAALATAGSRASPVSTSRGLGPYGTSPAAVHSRSPSPSLSPPPRNQVSAAPSPQPQNPQQQGSRRTRNEEPFQEDPAAVLEQSIALLSEIEGHIRASVGLPPDHPLQAIDPETALDIPLQLVEALEATLEVIAMARKDAAGGRCLGDTDGVRDGGGDGGRDRERVFRPPWQGPNSNIAPYRLYRTGSDSSAGGSGQLSRPASLSGNSGSAGGSGVRGGGGGSGGGGRSSRGSWAGGAGGNSMPGSQLPPISSGSSGGGGASDRSGAPVYGRPPPSHQHQSRMSPINPINPISPITHHSQRHPAYYNQNHPPQPPRSVSATRRTSTSSSGGGGGGGGGGGNLGGGGGSVTSIPSLAANISSRRPWHKEPPPEEWMAAKQQRADTERRKREAQLAADLRYLQQVRSRATEVQQTHDAILAQAEESVRVVRSAKASTQAQHRWLQYQDTVVEAARRHYETLMAQQQQQQQVAGGSHYRGF